MSDITKCVGEECPLKNKCYRSLAAADDRQSFFCVTPYNFSTESCDYFWSIEEEDIDEEENFEDEI